MLNELGQISHENKSTYPADALHAAYLEGYARALADAKAAVDQFDYLFDNIGHERIDKIKAAISALSGCSLCQR